MSMRWDEAVAFALSLPGAVLSTSYGKPSVKVRGRGILGVGREPGSFGLSATLEEIEMLKETDPACFWQTPHYEGWAAVLVREAAADPERIEALIERAWYARASRAQRMERSAASS
jgi:hypothetical protein